MINNLLNVLGTIVMYCNLDIFEKAGFDFSDIPKTLDDAFKIGKIIKEKTGKYAIATIREDEEEDGDLVEKIKHEKLNTGFIDINKKEIFSGDSLETLHKHFKAKVFSDHGKFFIMYGAYQVLPFSKTDVIEGTENMVMFKKINKENENEESENEEAYKIWTRMYSEGLIPSGDNEEILASFLAGNIAMYGTTSMRFYSERKNVKFKTGLAPFPVFKSKEK